MDACISCGNGEFKKIKKLEQYHTDLVVCARCGLAFMDPIPDADQITSLYQKNFYDKEGAVRFKILFEKIILFQRWLRSKRLRKLVRKGAVLDVGFSRGLTLSLLRKKGWDAYGTQLSRDAIENARRALGLEVYEGDLVDQHFDPEKFDIITLWHVLEHLRHPDRYLHEIQRIMRKHGTLVLEVPNLSSPIARIFGDAWFGLDLPHHLYNFSEESLKVLLERCGFSVFRSTYFSLEHSPFSLLQSTLNFFSKERNLLFESLKSNSTISYSLSKKILHLTFAVLTIIPITLFSLVMGLLKKGDIITLFCEKSGEKTKR